MTDKMVHMNEIWYFPAVKMPKKNERVLLMIGGEIYYGGFPGGELTFDQPTYICEGNYHDGWWVGQYIGVYRQLEPDEIVIAWMPLSEKNYREL